MTSVPPAPRRRLALVASAALIVVATVLRVAAARGPLWLDEMWSAMTARDAPNWWSLLTVVHHDNNHVLCSWLLRAMDPATSPLLLRLPSIVAGVASVAAAGALGRARGGAAALSAMALTATSFTLVQYSSEARGYSMAVLFALLAWLAMRRCVAEPTAILPRVAYSCCAVLGLLSHLTFVAVLAGFGLWSVRAWLRQGVRFALDAALRVHAVALAATVGLLAVILQDFVVGGGVSQGRARVAIAALSLVAGGPRGGALAIVVATAVAAVAAASLVKLRREGDDEWLLHAGTLAAAAAAVVLAKPGFVAERYFLLPATFLTILVATSCAATLGRRRAWRSAVTLAFLAVSCANAWRVLRLVEVGRGDAVAAFDWVAEDVGAGARVETMSDFRASVVLAWRGYEHPESPPVTLVPASEARSSPPECWLIEEFDERAKAAPTITHAGGVKYELKRTFPHSGLSGWTYQAYRRVQPR